MNAKYRVLFADDVDLHRNFLKSSLREAGKKMGVTFEIIGEGTDGQQLVDLYKSFAADPPDFVFSDIRMPNLDGLSALVKIRQLNEKQRVVMASSEDVEKIDSLNTLHGESERKTLETSQKMELLRKVIVRIQNDSVESGKTNSVLLGCEKLALDPIAIAGELGASAYLKKPYDADKMELVLRYLVVPTNGQYKTVA